MREGEADVKKELPGFNVANLIGANIDGFHKNPAHQRKMLSILEKPHNTMNKIGSRVFDLLVSPLIENRKRIGLVVEWADAGDRRQNLDYAARNVAIDRSQGVVEFTVQGNVISANTNFLKAMGYSFDEIRRQNHSMFVAVTGSLPRCRAPRSVRL
jgi:hypothetical protein